LLLNQAQNGLFQQIAKLQPLRLLVQELIFYRLPAAAHLFLEAVLMQNQLALHLPPAPTFLFKFPQEELVEVTHI